ncbi:MAG TPA: glycosyltransferase, partial [Candidatus Binataceae bacterium]|nr:glycosyltransferase [Candidatus Binataceae bacterium]
MFGRARMRNKISIVLDTVRVFTAWLHLRVRIGATRVRASNSRFLLFFAWGFPPTSGGGVHRPASIAKYAARSGWRVSVVASPLDEAPSAPGLELLQSLPATIAVSRAEAPLASYRMLPKVDGGFANMIAAVRTARAACGQERPSVVLVSGPPFMIFISAYMIARQIGAPLVLDYRDEWTVHTPGWISASAFDRHWERKVLQFSSAAIFVTELMRQRYLESIPGLAADKCLVIPNGWDPDDFARVASMTPRKHVEPQRFVISFIGSSVHYSSPGAFLAQFARVIEHRPALRDQLVLRFIGRKVSAMEKELLAFQNRLPGSIELVDEVPKADAVARMCGADALLFLLDSFYDHAIPGKLYEYLASGTPILAIGETGLAAELVRRLGAGPVVAADNPSSLEAAIDLLLREPRERWNTPARVAWLESHTRGALATRVLQVLDD